MAKGELFHVKHFVVEGVGEFPLDMLRYDRCWPKKEDDSYQIEDRRPINGPAHRRVTLTTHIRSQPSGPTIARWRSFGWKVIETDGRAM